MPLTELPTKTAGSLGPVKTDNRAYLRPDSELPAVELEQIKTWIIALATELGLSDGSTADSVREAVNAAGGAPNPFTGELLWAWNGTDLTQFEATALPHDRAGTDVSGKNAATEMSLSVVSAGGRLGNLIRITTSSSFLGGGMFPILANEIALPDRYVVRTAWGAQHANVNGGVYLMANPTNGAFRGLLAYRTSTQHLLRAIVDDHPSSAIALGEGGTNNAAAISMGGAVTLHTVYRQRTSDDPANWLLQTYAHSPANASPETDASDSTDFSISTDWDGIGMDRIGIGAHHALLTGLASTNDILDLRIYAHPED